MTLSQSAIPEKSSCYRVFLFTSLIVLAGCGAAKELPSLNAGAKNGLLGERENDNAADGLWLVDWDPGMKVRLQTLSENGILLVRFNGDTLEIMNGCEVPGTYRFQTSSKIKNKEYIRSKTDLFAKLPLGAVSLGAEYRQGDLWAMDYVMVGSKEASIREVDGTSLSSRCSGATHFVESMVVGALRINASTATGGGANAAAFNAGIGGGHSSKAEVIREEGDFETCVKGDETAKGKGCHATVKLFLTPIARPVSPALRKVSTSGSSVIDLGPITFSQNELVFFPHFVIPDRGITAMELDSNLPADIQRAWCDLMKRETQYREILMERVTRLSEIEGKRRTCLSLSHGCTRQHQYAKEQMQVEDAFHRRIALSKQTQETRRHQLANRLEKEYAKRSSPESYGAAVALAGLILDIRHDALIDGKMETNEAAPPLRKATALLEPVAAATSPDTASGWWARYLLGHIRLESESDETAIPLLQAITEVRWRPETVYVLFILGNHSLDVERDPEAAREHFSRMAEAAKKFDNRHAFGVARVMTALCAYYMERFTQALDIAASMIADPGQRSLHNHLSALAAECIEHLGGISKEPMIEAPNAVFARIATILANRAVQRRAIAEAQTAWRAVLDRAPDSIFAVYAVEGLIAVAERDGDEASASELKKRRVKTYNVDSPWADSLRARQDKDGTPTDEEISDAIAATTPLLPPRIASERETREDAIARLDGLLAHCFSTIDQAEVDKIAFEIKAHRGTDGVVVPEISFSFSASGIAERSCKERLVNCFEKDAPRYLFGIGQSFRAVMTTAK